jgi:hypothetical protein
VIKSAEEFGRRTFLKDATKAAVAAYALARLDRSAPLAASTVLDSATRSAEGYKSLFDGVSLKGWTPKARTAKQSGVGWWKVENGVIVGGQGPVGVGSYLVSDQAFSDFELEIEAKPDWPADTGIYIRANALGSTGFQVNLDYRPMERSVAIMEMALAPFTPTLMVLQPRRMRQDASYASSPVSHHNPMMSATSFRPTMSFPPKNC